nr:uncharacterized protein LOC123744946 [Procambarus clarkii]
MDIKLVVLASLVLLEPLVTSAQIITTRRRFPGQRRLGAANYGTHSYGKNGFSSHPVSRPTGRFVPQASSVKKSRYHGPRRRYYPYTPYGYHNYRRYTRYEPYRRYSSYSPYGKVFTL